MRATAVLVLTALLGVQGPLAAAPSAPVIGGTSAVLLDARSGRLLYALAPHLRRPPASTTKMMTALLVAESLTPETLVEISPRAQVERSGSAIGVEVGERWRVGDLMRALLMHSANDAAVALAEGVAGSVEAFAEQMNARARSLGARNTHFVSAHGRYHPQHYSTAYDLALIARAALGSPWIAKIVRSQTWPLRRGADGNGTERLLINTNKLLWRYPGADGVKTGWIIESGPTLAASATRGGWRLIAVVLNSPQVYTDAAALLNYGFGVFERVRAGTAGQIVGTARVDNGRRPLQAILAADAVVVVRRGAAVDSRVQFTRVTAPIAGGEYVGTAVYVSDGVEVARVPVVAAEGVPVRSLFARLGQWLRTLARGRR